MNETSVNNSATHNNSLQVTHFQRQTVTRGGSFIQRGGLGIRMLLLTITKS